MKTIHSIFIYPIKGMRGIELREAKLESAGLQYDRRWMLVDENGTFLSQRSHPKMATFIIQIVKDKIQVEFAGAKHQFLINSLTENNMTVSVFDQQMEATEVATATSAWFSAQLGSPVKLVFHSHVTRRIKQFAKYIDPATQNEIGSNTRVSFADGYPYLILGTASLELLNEKLTDKLTLDRFRPNIVVHTTEAHEEDNWKKVKIGREELFVIRPCGRCQVITIDQATGAKGKEPLTTLNQYRKVDNLIFFGVNAISLSNGLIRVGDVVEISE